MKKQFVLLMLLALATVQMRADIVIRCNEAGSSLDEKQIYIEGVCYEFHSAGDWYLEYLGGIPTTLNISGGYFEVVGHDESLPSEVNLREKFEPYKGDGKFFTAYFEKRTGDGQIQKTPLNIKFNNLSSDFSSDFFFSVTSIREKAFYGCSGLTFVTIPNSVTTIGKGAFLYCI